MDIRYISYLALLILYFTFQPNYLGWTRWTIFPDGLKPPTTDFPACSSGLLSVGCSYHPFLARKFLCWTLNPQSWSNTDKYYDIIILLLAVKLSAAVSPPDFDPCPTCPQHKNWKSSNAAAVKTCCGWGGTRWDGENSTNQFAQHFGTSSGFV